MKQTSLKRIIGATVFVALLGLGLKTAWADAKSSDTYKELNLFAEVFERVRDQYVEPVPDDKLIESALNGMLTALDPHSSYMNEKSFQDMQVQTHGEFGGLGLEVTEDNGIIKVVSPIDDTPAAHAGLKPGDYIIALDGESVAGLSLSEAVEKMRGEIGTDIRLTIRRGDSGEPFDITIRRDQIKIKSVKWDVKNDVGYIRITTFNEQTQPGLDTAIADIRKRAGDKLLGYVLDLRNNPGGLLEQAISVSSTFLDRGEVVSTRGRHSDDVQRFNAKSDGDETHGAPLVVLINGGSASASEIVAGALQDHARGIILGTQSFGKGSVQTIMQLQGHGAIRLTTARYYTPSGRSIQGKGITPDIEIKPARVEELAQIAGRREADLKGALKNTDKPADATPTTPPVSPGQVKPEASKKGEGKDAKTPAAKTIPTGDAAKPGEEPVDYQLERALDLLRGLSVFKSSGEVKASGDAKPLPNKPVTH